MADNNYQENRVSTTGITLFDDNSMMLRLMYLGDTFSVIIADPEKNENGKNTYPDKNRHSFLITADRAASLYHEIITKELTEAMQNHEDFSKGVFLNRGKTSLMEIHYKDDELYLVYFKDIDEERVAKENYVFHFQKTDTITGYTGDGSFDGQGSVQGNFYIFCKYLEAGVYELSNASGHSVRRGNQYTTNSIFNYLKSIAAKLGVTVEGGYKKKSDASGFMNIPEGSDEELPFAEAPTAGSMDDILG